MAVVASPVVQAATLTVVNNDGPGEGFNDPTPKAPVGGNNGTTLGAQRLIAFQHAADIWGGLIASAVTIRVGATFDPLSCNASSAVLGSAGAASVFRDFAGALAAATWYPGALANALNGSDLDPGGVDISAQFNSAFGTTCPFPRGWYYGLDGNAGSDIDFVTVLLHEMGHGLGFLTFVNSASGAKFLGFNDTFMLNLEDHGASPADYPSMTNAQRVVASTDPGNLHWVGAHVRAASGVLTAGKVGDHVRMFAPSSQQPGSSVSHWDTALTPNQLMEPSYTVPLDPGLELPLFQDIGWTLLATSPPAISVTPSSQPFGNVAVGSFADSNVTVQNTGGGTLTGTASTSAPFSIISGASYSLGPGAGQIVSVRFSPTSAATFAGNVTFTGGGGATRAVTGTGVLASFVDVPPSHIFWSWIEALVRAGITGGCATNPAQYCPDDSVARGQMAVFLLRGEHGPGYVPPTPTQQTFADVPLNSPFASWIYQLAAEGITGGCATNPAQYCPDDSVTRGQTAVFLLRGEHGPGYVPPTPAQQTFADVPLNHPFASWIYQLAAEGITGGCATNPAQYCPDASVTRAQMAVFLVRAFGLPL
jgi:hypothetical protein